MPLPHFLVLLALVIFAAGASIWLATAAGLPFPILALVVLLAAGVLRLFARVR